MNLKLACIILAAGKSTRMGYRNKLLMKYKEKEIIKHVYEKTLEFDFYETIIVLGWQAKELDEALEEYQPRIVFNELYHLGQAASILKGLDAIKGNVDGILFMLGDQPLIKHDTILRLAGAFEEKPHSIIVPSFQKKRGNPVIIPKRLFPRIKNLQGETGARQLFNDEELVYVEVDDPGVVFDMDTPHDYEKLLTINLD